MLLLYPKKDYATFILIISTVIISAVIFKLGIKNGIEL